MPSQSRRYVQSWHLQFWFQIWSLVLKLCPNLALSPPHTICVVGVCSCWKTTMAFLSIDTVSSVMTIIPCWHAKPNLKNHRVRTFYFYFLNNLCKSSDILKAGKLVELWLCQSLMKDIFASELSCSKLKKEVGKLTKKLTN